MEARHVVLLLHTAEEKQPTSTVLFFPLCLRSNKDNPPLFLVLEVTELEGQFGYFKFCSLPIVDSRQHAASLEKQSKALYLTVSQPLSLILTIELQYCNT